MLEHLLEIIIFRSRWLLAPMYLGLVGGLMFMFIKFVQEFAHVSMHIFSTPEREVLISVLALVDITLVANLLIMVIFSGYENFVSKIDVAEHKDRPSWMGKVDYSGLKLKMIGSIVAISSIDLLRAFMNQSSEAANQIGHEQMAWMVGLHITFIVSGVLFAWMDKISESTEKHH